MHRVAYLCGAGSIACALFILLSCLTRSRDRQKLLGVQETREQLLCTHVRGLIMKGFDLYEQWRSCVFEVSGFTERSWDALEIWERRAWEELDARSYPSLSDHLQEHRLPSSR